MALELPYYPSRSHEYQRIWARVHSKNPDYFRTFDAKEYRRNYYRQPEVKSRVSKKVQELRGTLLEVLGGKCNHCGFTDSRALQFDHIHGDGSKSRKESGNHRNRESYYRMLLQNPEYTLSNIQILCANCNWIKRFDNNEINQNLYGGN